MAFGSLFLIPVPLAEGTSAQTIPAYNTEVVNSIKTYIVENEKTARRWLKEMGLQTPQNELTILPYGKHSDKTDLSAYLKALLSGENVGLMSEAGCPGVADPGSEIVALAHEHGIKVQPLIGPSSILLALMASGFNGQSFTFHGYLPIDKSQRTKRLKELENLSERFNQTQIFIETPFRNNQLLEEIVRSCQSKTHLCVACNITAKEEQIKTHTIEQWRKIKVDLHKKPTIFLLCK
ncbi:SAM-dependent methyltransferase [Rubrolithibacter danxiaensis]|uniref:SAM-dependent methyltransferase n=1 Tax=Rubrolithibacter danxiaensis TaxID=3390805 RepID=UPI003BF8AF37